MHQTVSSFLSRLKEVTEINIVREPRYQKVKNLKSIRCEEIEIEVKKETSMEIENHELYVADRK